MARPSLLLITLDAFGTLYKPRQSVARQYLDIARSHNLSWSANFVQRRSIDHDERDSGKKDETLQAFSQSFKHAFKTQTARHPNYGKATPSMTPKVWWRNVVHDSFRPFMSLGSDFPEALSDELFNRFSGRDGYMLFPDSMPFLQQIRQWKQDFGLESGKGRFPNVASLSPSSSLPESESNRPLRLVSGVITNSDPRVARILESLDVDVTCTTEHYESKRIESGNKNHDIQGGSKEVKHAPPPHLDFVLTSYEMSMEKPDPSVFVEAEHQLATQLPKLISHGARTATSSSMMIPKLSWKNDNGCAHDVDFDHLLKHAIKVHIGDDINKDYWGARNSRRGWHSIWLDREGSGEKGPQRPDHDDNVGSVEKVAGLGDLGTALKKILLKKR